MAEENEAHIPKTLTRRDLLRLPRPKEVKQPNVENTGCVVRADKESDLLRQTMSRRGFLVTLGLAGAQALFPQTPRPAVVSIPTTETKLPRNFLEDLNRLQTILTQRDSEGRNVDEYLAMVKKTAQEIGFIGYPNPFFFDI